MALDSDLLDLHLHADKLSPRGIRQLVEQMQEERNLYRRTFSRVLDQVEDNRPNTNTHRLMQAFDAIQLELNESHWRASLIHLHWGDFVG